MRHATCELQFTKLILRERERVEKRESDETRKNEITDLEEAEW